MELTNNQLLYKMKDYFKKKCGIYFHDKSWHEFLSNESKYSKLIDWLNNEIGFEIRTSAQFNLSDDLIIENGNFIDTCLNSLNRFTLLFYLFVIITDPRCTPKMRENLEKFMCKYYKIHFNEMLNMYT